MEPPLNTGTVIGICIFLAGLSVPSMAILYASCCYDKNKDAAERARSNRAVGAKGKPWRKRTSQVSNLSASIFAMIFVLAHYVIQCETAKGARTCSE